MADGALIDTIVLEVEWFVLFVPTLLDAGFLLKGCELVLAVPTLVQKTLICYFCLKSGDRPLLTHFLLTG